MNRSFRAETRSRAKDDVKQRLLQSVDRVRRWEKRWVVASESTMRVYRWVPVAAAAAAATSSVSSAKAGRAKPLLSAAVSLSPSPLSNNNINSGNNNNNKENLNNSSMCSAIGDDSNTAFSGTSDSMDVDFRSVNFSEESSLQSVHIAEKR